MQLEIGKRLGPYEILAPLGAGGMGAVYRARDVRLSREVAIKVLPAELSSDPERLKRFEKEARSASSLNHPNIVTIYDIGSEAGVFYIAMERVEGTTLRDLLTGPPLPMRKLLQIAPQFAEGLAKAHEAGIVHRDLKPENVMVTKAGLVKILDFGLAKLTTARSGSDDGPNLTTETATSPGMLLGTVGYMSPEQVAGERIDFRSDQFSFGSILYEMATGARAFRKQTRVDTLSSIMHEEPEPIASRSPQAPIPLRWVIERCLAKEPAARYGATGDLARDLAAIRDHLSEVAAASGSVAAPHGSRQRWIRVAMALALLGALAAAAEVGRRADRGPPPVFKRLTFRRGLVAKARFLGAGDEIVYGAAWSGEPWRIFSTRLEGSESTLLSSPGYLQAVSRSGELAVTLVENTRPWAIATGGTLARLPLSGGAPREVLDDVQLADWGAESSLAAVHTVGEKIRLEYPIGTVLYETAGDIRGLRVSPGGDLVAILDNPNRGDDGGSVAVVDRSGKKRTLASGYTSMRGLAWSPDGREVWFGAARDGVANALYTVSLSGRERMLLRTPAPMTVLDVAADGSVLIDQHTTAMRIAGLGPGEIRERDLSWLDYSFACDLSSDGKSFTFDESGDGVGGSYRIYLGKTDGSPPTRLFDGSCGPMSPDGLWVFSTKFEPQLQGVLVPVRSGDVRPLSPNSTTVVGIAFLPDGMRMVAAGREPGHGIRLHVENLAGGSRRPITPEGISLIRASKPVSPDGRWVFANGPDGRLMTYAVEKEEAREVPGLRPGDRPLQWTPAGLGIFVMQRRGSVFGIFSVDVVTGDRKLWKEIVPTDPAGFWGITSFFVAADEHSYVYSYQRTMADLYLIRGLN